MKYILAGARGRCRGPPYLATRRVGGKSKRGMMVGGREALTDTDGIPRPIVAILRQCIEACMKDMINTSTSKYARFYAFPLYSGLRPVRSSCFYPSDADAPVRSILSPSFIDHLSNTELYQTYTLFDQDITDSYS